MTQLILKSIFTAKTLYNGLFLLSFLPGIYSQTCSSTDITDDEFLYGYDNQEELSLSFSGVIKRFEMIDTRNVGETHNNNGWDKNYIDARYVEPYLEIFTTENFKNYPLEQNSIQINVQIILQCSDVSSIPTLIFRQKIKKSNDYDPKFSKELYEFEIPLPFPKNFDLTLFEPISATDLDLYDNEVSFSSDNSGIINVGTSEKTSEDHKTYFATLILSQRLEMIPDVMEFTIVAKDKGTPQRSSAAIVRIKADQVNSAPPPAKFEKVLYEGKIDENGNLYVADVILVRETYNENVELSKDGNDKDLFDWKQNENILKIILAKPFNEHEYKDRNFLSFVIISTVDDSDEERTVVTIGLPPRSPALQFTKSLYEGSVDKSLKLTLENVALETSTATDVLFTLLGVDSNLFQLQNRQNSVTISLKLSVTIETIRTKQFLSLTINAISQIRDEIASAAILISVPRPEVVPAFERSGYSGTVYLDGSLEIDEIFLDSATYTNDVKFTLKGDFSDYFVIENKEIRIIIQLLKMFSETVIREASFISLEIQAVNTDNKIGTTSVIIELPEIKDLKFTKPVFEGSIDKFGKLIVEDVILEDLEFPDDIKFYLNGEYTEYFSITSEKTTMTVFLATQLPSELFKTKQFLQFFVLATKSGYSTTSAGITITFPLAENLPRFEKSLHHGIVKSRDTIEIESIALSSETNIVDITVWMQGDDAQYFSLQYNLPKIDIVLKNPIPDNIYQTTVYFSFEILAKNTDGNSVSTSILLDFPEKEDLQFTKAVFEGTVDEFGKLTIEDIVLERLEDSDGIEFSLNGDHSQFFDFSSEKTLLKLSLKEDLPDEILKTNQFLKFFVSATKTGYTTTTTTGIIISLPRSDNFPRFEKSLYHGNVTSKETMEIESILLDSETILEGLTVSAQGDDAKFFSLIKYLPKIDIILNNPIPDDAFQQKIYFSFEIVARTATENLVSTTVLLDLPEKEECSQTTTNLPNLDGVPSFQNVLYKFKIQPQFIGVIGKVYANVPQVDVSIRYKIYVPYENLKSKVFIDEMLGEITVTSPLNPGSYEFQLEAINMYSQESGKAEANVLVEAFNECPNGGIVVNKALLVKHIDEGREHKDLLSSKYEKCDFTIFSMEPNDKDYVKIDPVTNMLTTINIDREAEIFINMAVPQILVKILLNCGNLRSNFMQNTSVSTERIFDTSRSGYQIPPIVDGKTFVLTDDIDYSTDTTHLAIIINDINDNDPEFVYPPNSGITIGYPESKIASELLPEHLIQVYAIDKDYGLNAKLKFSVEENKHFGIDPEFGIVYPLRNAMQNVDEVSLQIVATDRNGASDGRSSTVALNVKKLNGRHLTLLSFKSSKQENVDNVLKELNEKTSLELMSLKSATVPGENDVKRMVHQASKRRNAGLSLSYYTRDQNDQSTILKAWIYGINEQNNLIGGAEIERKISVIQGINNSVSTQSYTSVKDPFQDFESTNFALILAVSLLGVLLIAVCGLAFLAWWFLIRPYTYSNMGNTSSGERTPSENSFKDDMPYRPTEPHLNKSFHNDMEQFERRKSVLIRGATVNDTNIGDQQNELQHNLQNILNGESGKSMVDYVEQANLSTNSEANKISPDGKRSMVTFNEMVERIDIVDDFISDDERL